MQDNAEQSTVQTLMMSNIASFERCVIKLVANSLNAHAAAIAIRIHATKREIQVIDNGVGIPKNMLKHIAKYNAEVIGDQQQVCKLFESNNLADIRRSADRLTITSRHQHSEETFMKVFEMGSSFNLKQVEQRPSCGTTVSIYGFHEMPHKKWDTSIICFFIAAIAVTKLEVSFSIRDDERKKVVLRIAKPHNSIEVLRTLVGKNLPLNHVWSIQCGPERNNNYHGYVGLSDKNAMQWIFLNHRPIYCPLILKLIKIVFEEKLNLFSDQKSNARDPYDENVFILFFLTFSQKEFTHITENGKIMFYDMQKVLNTVKNCAFEYLTSMKRASYENKAMKKMHNDIYKMQENSMNFDIANNSIKSDTIYCDSNNNNHTINMISPLSEWSNWTYYTNNKKRDTRNIFPENDICFRQFFELVENCQHEQIVVHPCKLKQKLCEFRLSQASLKCIKIINQVNNEFIAAWMMWNEMKILLMIDQHAIHERIRYENLLLKYKVQNENELLSVNLRDSLSMEFPIEMCNLFLCNQILLKKYGISLGSLKENTLLIRTVPQCLVTNNDLHNREKILPKISGLLNDVIKNCNTSQMNALPLTIHNAIASEACHGAIKFGDKLTLEECTSLIQLLKNMKFPNRCAHGRPTIIPVIEFSELERRSTRIPKVSTKIFPFDFIIGNTNLNDS
ncbi:DNA mismatch repair protein Mlh3 [Atta colombica]|uniref:DNA mismatch repair protein Mlh3 n=1 Tax=Atta colombica TaxID=520822 RepID=A0A195BJ76_9HYME|nr:DNA mismatch repair protein Mlh3 [Atta colombica]